MDPIAQNLKDNEMNLFKNEVYSHIREMETKLNAKININQSKLVDDIEAQGIKMNNLINNNKEVVLSIVTQKLKLEKISELETFKNKVDGMLITHEIRIKNNLEEISKIKLKYDKIVSENLYVSGFIGNACQFKNLSEYLSYNISEVSKLKLEKEQLKKDIKDLKSKFEGIMKNMISLNDKSVQLCNEYTDNKQAEFEKMLEKNSNEVNQKAVEHRALICHFQEKAEKSEKKYNEEFNKLMNMKKEFINLIEEKFVEIKNYHDELNKRVINSDLDIGIHKKKIDNINEQIKDLYQNTKDISFKVRNYYCANNKISNLLEKIENIGNNDTNAEILKFKNQINYNINNNINNYSVSPKKRIVNKINEPLTTIRPAIDEEVQPFKRNSINSSGKVKKKKKIFNKIGINNNKNETSESDSSISVNNDKNNNIDKEKKIKNENDNKKNNNNNNKETKVNKKTSTSRAESTKIKKKNENSTLPALTRNIKDDITLDEIKKITSSSNEMNKSEIISNEKDKKKKIKKDNIISLINDNNNKLKINQKKDIIQKKEDYQLEQDKQACKLVTLTLPNPSKELFISKKKKIMKEKFKTDMVNNLINSYRAKLFSKVLSPDEKVEIDNEILDIPKKVTQAFGRTTYTFYFKKDQIKCMDINKNNINSSGNSKRSHKKNKTLKKNDTEN